MIDPDPLEKRVLAGVAATGEPYDVIEIDPDLADTAAFCEHYGYAPDASANCILVASRDDPPALAACLVPATTRLDVNKRVRKLLGVRKCSFASAALTREATGMEIGGVTPFGMPDRAPGSDGPLPLWVDARIGGLDRVIVGGGSRRCKLHVPPAALTAVGGELIEDLALPA